MSETEISLLKGLLQSEPYDYAKVYALVLPYLSPVRKIAFEKEHNFNRLQLKTFCEANFIERVGATVPPAEKAVINYHFAPDKVKALVQRRNAMYRERDSLFYRMQNPQLTVTDRFEMAKRQLELDKDINKCWEQLEYWQANGNLPQPTIVPVSPEQVEVDFEQMSAIEIAALIKNIEKYISKYAKREEFAEKVKAKRLLLEQAKEILKKR